MQRQRIRSCPGFRYALKRQKPGMRVRNSRSGCRHHVSDASYFMEQDMIREKESKMLLRRFHRLWDNVRSDTVDTGDSKGGADNMTLLPYPGK